MKKFIIGFAAFAPALAMAQVSVTNPTSNFGSLLTKIGGLVNSALPIVVGLALLGFFWGLMKFVFNAGNEEAKEQGKHIMIYGIIALFVMVAVWGLVGFIAGSIGIGTGGNSGTLPGVTNLPQ